MEKSFDKHLLHLFLRYQMTVYIYLSSAFENSYSLNNLQLHVTVLEYGTNNPSRTVKIKSPALMTHKNFIPFKTFLEEKYLE